MFFQFNQLQLCFEIYFLRKQFKCALMFWNVFSEGAILKNTYVLKCIFWGNNLFKICGCCFIFSWLLNSVVAVFVFFIKVFTASKNFCDIDMYKYKFKMYKDCGSSKHRFTNKQMGRVCVLKISMKPFKLQGRTASSQGGLDKSRLCPKCQEGA